MIASAVSALPESAAIRRANGAKSSTKSMPRTPSKAKLSRHPTSSSSSWSSSSPVSARGILDSYRSAQQQAPAAPEPSDDFDDDEGGEACPVGCVTEIFRKKELEEALAAADARASSSSSASSSSPPPRRPPQPLSPGIVVVDFYKKACGACKYIAPGFVKLCKSANNAGEGAGGGGEVPDIVFLKHDVERDGDGSDSDSDGAGGDGGGRTALAVSLKIRSVPLFHVYRGRELVASFATRDRKRVADAINEAVGREVL